MNERQAEMQRIYNISVGEYAIANSQDMLYGLLKNVDFRYFLRADRRPIEELMTPDLKTMAISFYRFIDEAPELSDICKHRVMAAVEYFLHNTCKLSEREMQEFKRGAAFDPATYDLFQELGA